MARMLVVVGDHLHLGGTVVAGSPFTDIDGRAVARVNDPVVCKVHGPGVIASGDATLIIDGNPVARHGDKASCGCTLLAGQQAMVSVDAGGSGGSAGRSSNRMAALLGGVASVIDAASKVKAGPTPSYVPDGATSTAPQCWVEDHSTHISVNPDGRYFEGYDPEGVRYVYELHASFRIDVPLNSGGDIVVTSKIRVETRGNVSAGDITTAKLRLLEGIDAVLNNRFTLTVTDPQCGSRRFKIRYDVEYVTSGEDYVMRLHARYPREKVKHNVIYVSVETNKWVHVHEFGHCLGLPDEYVDDGMLEDTIKFFRPDGIIDGEAVIATSDLGESDPLNTFMYSHPTATKPRHAWNIGLEVRELLSQEIGREVTCTVT